MKQWNFKMKKLFSETLKTLIIEVDKPGRCAYEKLLRKKLFVLYVVL